MTDYSHLMIGLNKFSIKFINPTEEQYIELFKEEPDKELKYCWEYKGVRNCKLDIYLQSPQEDIFKTTIWLKDEDKVSKTNKQLFVNCVAGTQWVEDSSQLWDSFTTFEKILSWENGRPKDKKIIGSKDHHIAKVGEDELLHLLSIVQHVDPYNTESNLFLDLDKLFEGDFTELRERIPDSPSHLIALAYVNTDLEQKIWRSYLDVSLMREINTQSFSKQNQKIFNAFKKDIESEYNGLDGSYILEKMRPMTEKDLKIQYHPSDDNIDYDNSLNN